MIITIIIIIIIVIAWSILASWSSAQANSAHFTCRPLEVKSCSVSTCTMLLFLGLGEHAESTP